tara:strand:+ start:2285 stop:2473 length:189 start_codon:yes stop_codon:yes gene_type:complete
MSLFEKIAFLESFFKLFKLKKKVQLKSEIEIDELLSKISGQLNNFEEIDAKMQINSMPVFYN